MSCCRDIVGCPFPLELKDSNADDARGEVWYQSISLSIERDRSEGRFRLNFREQSVLCLRILNLGHRNSFKSN